jgi:hypothetical protein
MATKRKKKTEEEYDAELRAAWARKQNPIPRRNPKSGPPLYFNYEGGTIPLEKILEAVRAVQAERRKSTK